MAGMMLKAIEGPNASLDKLARRLAQLKGTAFVGALENSAFEAGQIDGVTYEECVTALKWAWQKSVPSEKQEFISATIERGLLRAGKKPTIAPPISISSTKPAAKPFSFRDMRGNNPASTFDNALEGIKALGLKVRHDIFHNTVLIECADKTAHDVAPLIGEVLDPTLIRLRTRFNKVYGFDAGEKNIYSAVMSLAYENIFNPVAEIIDKAHREWDENPRLDRMAADYLCVEDTELNNHAVRKHMIASIRRVREPGCKYDVMVVLESDEGWNKSSAIRIIAGEENFSDEAILGSKGKEVMELLRTVWHHECAELTDIRKTEVEHVKAFLSRTWDMHRPAYGRMLVKQPRQSVEWGTTNDTQYLVSPTGNRRFAPMRLVRRIDLEKLSRDRLQLIGEAAHYEAERETLFLPETMWAAAKIEQEKRRAPDPWEDILSSIPDSIPGADGQMHSLIHRSADDRDQIASADIMTYLLKVPAAQQNGAMGRRLSNAMTLNGWEQHESKLVKINGKSARGYWRFSAKP